MKRNAGIAVVGAAVLLTSSGILVSTLANTAPTAEIPALSVEQSASVTPSAPLFLVTASYPFSAGEGTATWREPVGDVGKVDRYIVTFKQEGQEDRSLATTNTFTYLPPLEEDTSYEVEVRAEVKSLKTGETLITPVAKSQLKTGDFFG